MERFHYENEEFQVYNWKSERLKELSYSSETFWRERRLRESQKSDLSLELKTKYLK